MTAHKPSAAMKIVTTCERIQPTCAGVDANGELVWEGRAMARWQMEMFKVAVNWFGGMLTRWLEVTNYQTDLEEFDPTQGGLAEHRAAAPAWIAELKAKKIRKPWKHQGD